MQAFRKLTLSVAIASTLAMAGCGGSSGGGDSSSDFTSPSSFTVSGTAVKGILKNATVTAYELDESTGMRLKGGVVGNATTDNNGNYSVLLNEDYKGGSIEIEITVNEDTVMICDASACGDVGKGEELNLADYSEQFALSAFAPAATPGSTVSVPVTAWSTMAAHRTRALLVTNNSFSSAFKQAKAEVNQIAGFDVADTPARAITNLANATAEEAQAAVMNAVVAELIFGESDLNGQSPGHKLLTFAEALNDGVVQSNDGFTPAELAAVTQSVADDTTDLDEETEAAINNQIGILEEAGDSLDPEYDDELDPGDDSDQATKIEAFQQFTEQFRTWASSINEAADALRDDESTISTALEADVETLNDVFTQAGVTGDLISKVLDAFTQQLSGDDNRTALADALENGGTYTADQDWTDEQDSSVSGSMDATLTFENTEDGLKATIIGEVSQTEGEFRTFDFELTTSLTADDLDLDTGKVLALLAENTVGIEGTVKDGAAAERASVSLEATLGLYEALEDDVSEETVLESLSSVEFEGNITLADPEAASFTGAIHAIAVGMYGSKFSELDAPFSPQLFSLDGTFTSAQGHQFTLAANINNNNAQSFNLFTYLDYNDTTAFYDFEVAREDMEQFVEFHSIDQEYEFHISSNNSCWDGESEAWGERVAYVNGINSATGQTDYNCNILDDAEVLALNTLVMAELEGAVPEDLLSQLSVDNLWSDGNSYDDTASVDAEIRFPDLETADNFLNLSLTLSSVVVVDDLPEAAATVTVDRNALGGGIILTNVRWDGGSYSLKVSSEDLDAEEPQVSLEFWNPQGFRLEAVGTESVDGEQSLTGDVYIDGEDIGDVTLRNGVPVIVYPNGDEDIFETLF